MRGVGGIALLILSAVTVTAGPPRILKVLPHWEDRDGRISTGPGLFERDAYQAKLRSSPELVSALRYDVQWRSGGLPRERLRLRIWLRTAQTGLDAPASLEAPVLPSRRVGGWSSLTLTASELERLGEILAWRIVLLDGETEVAEQRSFLW